MEIQLNKNFSLICDWFAENKLSIYFGVDKTKSILFSSKRKIKKASPLNIQYKDKIKIKQYKKVTYSGCILLEAFCGECMARSIFLYGQNKFLGIPLRRLLCNTIIQPFFDYACKAWYLNCFFSIGVFFHRQTIHRTARDHLSFHSTTSTCSQTLKHLFATLHVRWLSRIFNRNICIYQTATWWDLPPYQITIWLTDWWCNVCFLDELILGFCYSDLTQENR